MAAALAAAEHVPLSLALLGVPEVRWARGAAAGTTPEVLPLARRQARALLYRLAVQRGPTARAHLCLLFWPGLPEAAARRNLTHLLTLLRRGLPEPTVVRATDDNVSLDGERTWCDAVVFTELTATADPRSRPAALQQAVTLYRGVFLDGFALLDSAEFDAWLAQERDVWERRYRDVLSAVSKEAPQPATTPPPSPRRSDTSHSTISPRRCIAG